MPDMTYGQSVIAWSTLQNAIDHLCNELGAVPTGDIDAVWILRQAQWDVKQERHEYETTARLRTEVHA